MCVEAAGGRVDRLKAAVKMVADNEEVEFGALANYMAFRLALQDVNWWGAATNLQSNERHPWGDRQRLVVAEALNWTIRTMLTMSDSFAGPYDERGMRNGREEENSWQAEPRSPAGHMHQ